MIEADDRSQPGRGAFCAGLAQRLTPVTEQAYRELSISDADGWRRRLTSYQRPNDWRGLFELAATVLPLGFCWLMMLVALQFHVYWLYGFLLFPAAGFLVRLFMIQHDCGHGAFFGNATANHWVGRLAGVLTLTPYDHSRRTHAIHHATSSNLDRRGIGDINTLTSGEYRARSAGRLSYRLYRHPAVMFGLGRPMSFSLRIDCRWLDAQGMDALGQHDIDEPRHRRWGWPDDLGFRRPDLAHDLCCDRPYCGGGGRLAFFRSAPVRPGALGPREAMERGRGRARQLGLCMPAPWVGSPAISASTTSTTSRVEFPVIACPRCSGTTPPSRTRSHQSQQSLTCPRLALWDETRQRLVSFKDVEARSARGPGFDTAGE